MTDIFISGSPFPRNSIGKLVCAVSDIFSFCAVHIEPRLNRGLRDGVILSIAGIKMFYVFLCVSAYAELGREGRMPLHDHVLN